MQNNLPKLYNLSDDISEIKDITGSNNMDADEMLKEWKEWNKENKDRYFQRLEMINGGKEIKKMRFLDFKISFFILF